MIFNRNDQEFMESIAKTETGSRWVRLLENIEAFYADIRNLKGVDPVVRVDALKMIREALLDKLLILSGKKDVPDNDEFR